MWVYFEGYSNPKLKWYIENYYCWLVMSYVGIQMVLGVAILMIFILI